PVMTIRRSNFMVAPAARTSSRAALRCRFGNQSPGYHQVTRASPPADRSESQVARPLVIIWYYSCILVAVPWGLSIPVAGRMEFMGERERRGKETRKGRGCRPINKCAAMRALDGGVCLRDDRGNDRHLRAQAGRHDFREPSLQRTRHGAHADPRS